MKFSRRDVIKGMGAAGLTPMLVSACGGDSGTGLPPVPELREYEFSGTPGPATMFEHGVASGDPLADGVILGTRASPDADGEIEVWWEMSLDPEFTQRTAQDTVTTDSSADYTVKVDVPEDYRTRFSQYRRAPDLQELHRQAPFIVVWDDHESANNSWIGGAENHNPDPPDNEGPWEVRIGAAYAAMDGEAKAIPMSGPETDNEATPPLAPT